MKKETTRFPRLTRDSSRKSQRCKINYNCWFGNKTDINENDLLEYLKDDEQTKVIILYLEDKNVDGVITIWTPTLMAETKTIAQEISKIAPHYQKPIIGCLFSLENTKEVIQTLWDELVARANEIWQSLFEYRCREDLKINDTRTVPIDDYRTECRPERFSCAISNCHPEVFSVIAS